jgi:hypothetical protein
VLAKEVVVRKRHSDGEELGGEVQVECGAWQMGLDAVSGSDDGWPSPRRRREARSGVPRDLHCGGDEQ